MIISNEQYERIQQFLDAAMTLEEMEAFENELDAYPEIRQQLNFEQSVRDNFILKKIKESAKNEIKTPVIKINRKRWVVLIAAACVIALVFTTPLFIFENKLDPATVHGNDPKNISKKDSVEIVVIKESVDSNRRVSLASLVKQYFTTDEIPETYPLYLAEALTGYENGEYESVQNLNLSEIPESRGTDEKQTILELGHYYKGIAFLQIGNPKKAITNMTWLENNCTNNELKIKAEWYLALAYLKNNNTAEATKLLKKIANESIYLRYKDKAKNLLKAFE